MFARLQFILPQRWISALFGFFARRRCGRVTRIAIAAFIRHFNVDMSESQVTDITQFPTFNAFFTRLLREDARPINQGAMVLVSPVDGEVSQCGRIDNGTLFQAKGHHYTLSALLSDTNDWAGFFSSGCFLTAYLSPKDYHRVHMPYSGRLEKISYVPGDLFAVKPSSVEVVPGLFARNERVILLFSSAQGRFAVILIGALIVGSIVITGLGRVRGEKSQCQSWDYSDQPLDFNKGDELGYFELGSSVIILTETKSINWNVGDGDSLLMGRTIASIESKQAK